LILFQLGVKLAWSATWRGAPEPLGQRIVEQVG
jgi:hypothetical protein